MSAVDVLSDNAQMPPIPAVAQNRAEHVGAGLEAGGHVVGTIIDPLVEIGPTG